MRIVCMDDGRTRIRGGIIIRFATRQHYWETESRTYAVIRFDDDQLGEYPAHPWLWTAVFDGIREYHY